MATLLKDAEQSKSAREKVLPDAACHEHSGKSHLDSLIYKKPWKPGLRGSVSKVACVQDVNHRFLDLSLSVAGVIARKTNHDRPCTEVRWRLS